MVALEVGDVAAPVLEIRDLEKRFGNIEVLKGISIDMARGDFLVLVGPSGCGKSTLLNCIAGLDETSGGEIVIGGPSGHHEGHPRRHGSRLLQRYPPYPLGTVAENTAPLPEQGDQR